MTKEHYIQRILDNATITLTVDNCVINCNLSNVLNVETGIEATTLEVNDNVLQWIIKDRKIAFRHYANEIYKGLVFDGHIKLTE